MIKCQVVKVGSKYYRYSGGYGQGNVVSHIEGATLVGEGTRFTTDMVLKEAINSGYEDAEIKDVEITEL